MSEKKKEVIGTVILKDVRLSFADLFQPKSQKNEDGTERKTFGANFLIPKDKSDATAQANLKKIKAAAAQAMAKKFGEDQDKWPKIKADRKCLRDGDDENWDGYADNWYLSTNSPEARPPSVVTNRKDKDGKWVRAKPGEEGCPYSGCYVNAIARIWVQDNEHGKRINASLESVQFLRAGEAFGAAPVNPDDMFDDDDVGEYGEFGDEGDEDDDLI